MSKEKTINFITIEKLSQTMETNKAYNYLLVHPSLENIKIFCNNWNLDCSIYDVLRYNKFYEKYNSLQYNICCYETIRQEYIGTLVNHFRKIGLHELFIYSFAFNMLADIADKFLLNNNLINFDNIELTSSDTDLYYTYYEKDIYQCKYIFNVDYSFCRPKELERFNIANFLRDELFFYKSFDFGASKLPGQTPKRVLPLFKVKPTEFRRTSNSPVFDFIHYDGFICEGKTKSFKNGTKNDAIVPIEQDAEIRRLHQLYYNSNINVFNENLLEDTNSFIQFIMKGLYHAGLMSCLYSYMFNYNNPTCRIHIDRSPLSMTAFHYLCKDYTSLILNDETGYHYYKRDQKKIENIYLEDNNLNRTFKYEMFFITNLMFLLNNRKSGYFKYTITVLRHSNYASLYPFLKERTMENFIYKDGLDVAITAKKFWQISDSLFERISINSLFKNFNN